VSNRLPLRAEEHNGVFSLRPSDGGLVTALLPVLRANGGCWIGWTGSDSDADLAEALKQCGGSNYSFEPVSLNQAERSCYYEGCCNQIIWPLFHGLPSRCDFDPDFWDSYCQVNDKFADAVERAWGGDDFIWVHDYHLMLLADCLRARGSRCPTGYFHHIPFPHPEVLEKLPWRDQLLRSMLQFNSIGFQTVRDKRNFIRSIRQFLSNVHVQRLGNGIFVRSDNRCAAVGTYPISIDFEEFANLAAEPATVAEANAIRSKFGHNRIILGIDRLDYTKGILERLKSFEVFLAASPDLCGQISMLQVVVPSREDIDEYQQLKLAIETRVSQINGKYASPGWVPVHYIYRNVSRAELVSFYRAADVALVLPLKDGMNLIAKEFCACRADDTGVLILSEFAGAAVELRCGALIVNPHDVQGVASALHRALRMEKWEQCSRMASMRNSIRVHNVYQWSSSFIQQALKPVTRSVAIPFASESEPISRSRAAAVLA
jgi:trehalose 6-phosphate synthase